MRINTLARLFTSRLTLFSRPLHTSAPSFYDRSQRGNDQPSDQPQPSQAERIAWQRRIELIEEIDAENKQNEQPRRQEYSYPTGPSVNDNIDAIYERYVRDQIKKYGSYTPSGGTPGGGSGLGR